MQYILADMIGNYDPVRQRCLSVIKKREQSMIHRVGGGQDMLFDFFCCWLLPNTDWPDMKKLIIGAKHAPIHSICPLN